MGEPLPINDPSWQPTHPVSLAIAEECLGTFKWLRSAWGGDHQDEAMRRAMEHALEGWEPPTTPPWRTAFQELQERAEAAASERDALRALLSSLIEFAEGDAPEDLIALARDLAGEVGHG